MFGEDLDEVVANLTVLPTCPVAYFRSLMRYCVYLPVVCVYHVNYNPRSSVSLTCFLMSLIALFLHLLFG